MEPATRFDLEAAIQSWRANLSEELAGQADALAELEEHLRTSVAALREAGLSDEESLLIAQRRLGPTPDLGAEFRQSNPASVWRRRVFWMALGSIGVHLWGSFVSPIRTWLSMQMTQAGQTWRIAAPVAYVVIALVPLLVAIPLAKGTLAAPLRRLSPLFANRRRTACFLSLFVAAGFGFGQIGSLMAMHAYGTDGWRLAGSAALMSLTWGIPLGLFVAWLMPSAPTPARMGTTG